MVSKSTKIYHPKPLILTFSTESEVLAYAGRAVFLRQALPVSSRFLELSRRAYNSDIYSLDFANDPVGAQILINR